MPRATTTQSASGGESTGKKALPKAAAKRQTASSRKLTAKPSAARAPRQSAASAGQAELTKVVGQLRETTAWLAEEVAGLRESLAVARPGSDPTRQGQLFPSGAQAPVATLEELAQTLRQASRSLADSLAETPKVADFEPLAEHLYEFAQLAPRLLESLEEIPKVVEPVEKATRALQEVSETLQYTHERFSESLLQLPRAEEFEPLAAPLSEFARVSPELAKSLGDVLKVVAPLGEAVRDVAQTADSLRATQGRLTDAIARSTRRAPAVGAPAELSRALREVATRMLATENSIQAALAGLPRDPEYARFAAQLKELATVSPSLMEWLKQVPALTEPLTESVEGLAQAAATLREGRDQLDAVIEASES